ncbi:DUF4127 family protein [Paenibacillus rubinfantis]|uniref:DUF4127 family protein n=1 Tax=Paenibacillus rubinfantis TaxID=1720296 RepID=UPI00073E9990|nr:DUF4127 family protein [Paenibacillus rubinfantis]
MAKVVYVPLDERPCNALFPRQLAEMTDVTLDVPDRSMLGNKKRPADTSAIREWLIEAAEGADYLLVSVDLLVYGGIVPSRVHHLSPEECLRRLEVLGEIKRRNPRVQIHAFNLIMRVPNNNKDEEEPDYYKFYGGQIFKYSYLTDKAKQEALTSEEQQDLENVMRLIPKAYLSDFVERRAVNQQVNQHVLTLVREGVIDHLVIPLDDNSQYGFSRAEQQMMVYRVEVLNVLDKVLIYPGADEVGCTMFARIFGEIKQYKPEIFVRYSSTHGPFIKPKYEDRSLNESVKSHITAVGAVLADHSAETDLVLLVHSPAVDQAGMAEQIPFQERHRSYFSEIHYREIAEAMGAYLQKGKRVALGDVATCNGGDPVLMNLLQQQGRLDQLTAYAGWNTSGNTLGTVIAHLVIASYYADRWVQGELAEAYEASRRFYYHRLAEDFLYQSLVRQDMLANDLPRLNACYYTLEHCLEQVEGILAEKMNQAVSRYFADIKEGRRIRLNGLHFPWRRMFEVGFELTIEGFQPRHL